MGTISKADIILSAQNKNAAARALPRTQAQEVFDMFFHVITEEIARGNRVELRGFGAFEAKATKARKGRNPATGQAIEIPEGKKVRFKPGQLLKAAVEAGEID